MCVCVCVLKKVKELSLVVFLYSQNQPTCCSSCCCYCSCCHRCVSIVVDRGALTALKILVFSHVFRKSILVNVFNSFFFLI